MVRILRVAEVLGPIAVSIGIFYGTYKLQKVISTSDLMVKKVEVIAQMAQSKDETQTQQAILNLSSTLGAEAIPFLLARLEHYGEEIMSLRKDLKLPDLWPLPNEVLSAPCQGDPVYSRVSPLARDSLSLSLAAAQRGWNATVAAIRMMGTDNFSKLFEVMRRNEHTEATRIYLQALVELRASELNGMESYLESAVNDPDLGARSRGDALTILAYGKAKSVRLNTPFSLDLTCREVPAIALAGASSSENPRAVGYIQLDRMHWREAHISNVSFRGIAFNDSRFTRSVFTNVQFDGLNALISGAERPRTLEVDSTIFDDVVFDNVNLRSSYVSQSLLRNVRVRASDMDAGTLVSVWIDNVQLEDGIAPRYIDIAALRDMTIRGTSLNPMQFTAGDTTEVIDSPGGLWRTFRGEGFGGVEADNRSLASVDRSNAPMHGPEWFRNLCQHSTNDGDRRVACR
jgi:hypothetical protein